MICYYYKQATDITSKISPYLSTHPPQKQHLCQNNKSILPLDLKKEYLRNQVSCQKKKNICPLLLRTAKVLNAKMPPKKNEEIPLGG